MGQSVIAPTEPAPTARRIRGDRPGIQGRVAVDGKQFAVDGERFQFRGVTYGTFAPRSSDGARFPERDQLEADFAAMHRHGFTVVRTYTPPPDDLLELACDWGLRIFAGVFYPDWRYLVGAAGRDRRRVEREARAEVRSTVRRLAGNECVLALSLGNEVPADVIRWNGTKAVSSTLADLADVVRDVDPRMLVTYANFPTAEYLPLDTLDFLTFNVFLERKADLRRYVTRLHHLAGDRPLVLGEFGLDSCGTAEGERHQAGTLDWQLETAIERGVAGTCVFSWTDEWHVGENAVEGWHFGLTRADRTPKPALDVVAKWNARTVRDLDVNWPSISVVICAYNGAATLEETLIHTCALDYPKLEIIVVDDGSTDDTAAIAARHPRAILHTIPHAGLSVARNEGYRVATGDVVAYLDSDAYPTPEWQYFLALAFDAPMLGGVGGPNFPPLSDGRGAKQVAQAPGGPVHVLMTDDRAEHVPGCNMAFYREVLVETGGFDPVYVAAGDDVDFCWRVLDRGWEIGFHPAALVWHHRRTGLRPYLRQQRGYGRSEALVEARHPDRYNSAGSARWKGRIYNVGVPSGRARIYRGLYASGAYQSIYRGGGHSLDIAHQVGVPAALALLLTAPLAILSPFLVAPAAIALAFLLTLVTIDTVRARPPRDAGLGFRFGVAMMHLLQPAVRSWHRWRHRLPARRGLLETEPIPGPVTSVGRGVLLLPESTSRPELASAIVSDLRRDGVQMVPANGWEDFDARLLGSTLIRGDLVTSSHPQGSVQVRVRRRPRALPWIVVIVALVATALVSTPVAIGIAAVAAAESARGLWNTGPRVRRIIRAAAKP